jgi:glycerophosphoryl diester phosphodiesterase
MVIMALTVGLAASQPTGDDTGDDSAPPPVLVVGHRGASAAAPEHTGASYDRAVWAGADVLECDLQVTADDQLVCLHDATVDRTTGGSTVGPVNSFTLAELQEMDFGTWFGPEFAGAGIVTLDEQIACYRAADPTMQFYVETKTSADDGDQMETLLVEQLRALDVVPEGVPDVRTSPVIIQSFDAASLATVRSLAPSLPTALLLNAATPEIETGQLPDVEVIAPNTALLAAQPDLVTTAHDAGVEVHTWTVDDPAEMTGLIDAGIDGFFTNVPDVARGVVDDAGRGSGREPLDADGAPPAEPSAVPECPEGMGLGLTAATDEGATDPSTATTADDAQTAADNSDTDSSVPIVPVAVGLVVLAAVVGLVVVVVRGRSARDASDA